MFDCANVEMRELLPELVAGTIGAATRARVEEHLASCAECAAELETLRLVHAAYGNVPSVSTARIVAALPKPPVAQGEGKAHGAPRPWMDWRIAAALTMVTVGGLSLAVTQRMRLSPPTGVRPAPTLDSANHGGAPVARGEPGTRRAPDTGIAAAPTSPAAGTQPRFGLSFGGGTGDLDASQIEALMGALDEIDRAPLAPPAEPDRSSMLPVIGGTSE